MHKKYFLIFLAILFLNFISASDSQLYQACGGDAETTVGCLGDSQLFFTGSAILQNPPTLTIIQPQNGTYITSKNLELNFSVANQNHIWYNLDSGSNTTITAYTKFNTTEGQHTLFLYANNSNGETAKSVTFTVNSTMFLIHYSHYTGSTKGNSTSFNSSSFKDIQNLSGIILENINYGKIQFNEVINITNDLNSTDNLVDLDTYTTVSSNRIEVNSTALPNFNKSATLSLYGLTFTNPRILRDGEVCPSAICAEQGYSGGTLIFNVTSFSVYSSEETPAGTPPETPTQHPSGGGGGAAVSAPTFSLSTNNLKAFLRQGEITTQTFTITNNGKQAITVTLTSSLGDLVRLSENSVDLNPGESKEITIDFIARDDTPPDLYLGSLLFQSGSASQTIFAALEIESKNPLLDVAVSLPFKDQEISPGGTLMAQVTLYNLGSSFGDVFLEYLIKNDNGEIILNQTDSVALQTQASFVKSFNIPGNAPVGHYLLYVRANYLQKIASASVDFNLVASSSREKIYIIIIVILVILITAIIGLMIILRLKKHYRPIKRVGAEDLLWR